jgi:hypothetical protein
VRNAIHRYPLDVGQEPLTEKIPCLPCMLPRSENLA